MAPFILTVRPEPDCSLDVAALDRRSVPGLAGPLMKSVTIPNSGDPASNDPAIDIPHPSQLGGLVFTSRHAVSGLVAALNSADLGGTNWAKLPVFSVGHATARAAMAAGFANPVIGQGGGAGLVPAIRRKMEGNPAPLFWPAAKDRSFDMAAALAPDFKVIMRPVYRMQPVGRLPDAVLDALAYGRILAVILMSPRSAELFCQQLAENGMDHCRPEIMIIAGSDSIAAAAGEGWRQIFTAKRPTRARLLAIASLVYHRRANWA